MADGVTLREGIAAALRALTADERLALRVADEILDLVDHAKLPEDLLDCHQPVQPHTGWEYGVSHVDMLGKEWPVVATEQSMVRQFLADAKAGLYNYRFYRRRPATGWERVEKVPRG